MRLIDADKLRINCVCVNGICVDGRTIENAPTVKAIPIEWLKRLQWRYLEAECNMSACVVNEILNLWEKENGKC